VRERKGISLWEILNNSYKAQHEMVCHSKYQMICHRELKQASKQQHKNANNNNNSKEKIF